MAKANILKESLVELKQIQDMIKESSTTQVKDILSEAVKEGLKNIINEANDFEEEEVNLDDENNIDGEVEDTEVETPEGDVDVEVEEPEAEEAEEAGMDSDEDESDEDDFDIEQFKGEDDEYDFTNASTEDVVKVYKKITADDSVVVTDLGDGKIDLKDEEDEYIIDTNGEDGVDNEIEIEIGDEEPVTEDVNSNDDDSADADLVEEVEIELGADEEGEGMVDEKAMTQSYSANRRVGVLSQTRAANAPGANKRDGGQLVKTNESKEIKAIKTAYANKLKKINEENEMLKQTLGQFKTKLQENAVLFNNLGKYVKLVTENATTKEEKVQILNRFANESKSIEQGNQLFESINKELNGKVKTPIKIDKQFGSFENKKINEQVIYQSPEINESISLMKRMQSL